MGVHAKFLVHWTDSDFVKNLKPDALVEEYAKRLKDDYQKGLYAKRKKERMSFQGHPTARISLIGVDSP